MRVSLARWSLANTIVVVVEQFESRRSVKPVSCRLSSPVARATACVQCRSSTRTLRRPADRRRCEPAVARKSRLHASAASRCRASCRVACALISVVVVRTRPLTRAIAIVDAALTRATPNLTVSNDDDIRRARTTRRSVRTPKLRASNGSLQFRARHDEQRARKSNHEACLRSTPTAHRYRHIAASREQLDALASTSRSTNNLCSSVCNFTHLQLASYTNQFST